MNGKLLNRKKYPPRCEYCAKGRVSPNGRDILCKKNGIMPADGSCSSYRYDVLKRVPKSRAILPSSDPKDFEL